MTTPASTPPAPSNVITALAAVMAEIGGVAKTRGSRDDDGPGIRYAYRGIDAIAAAAQPLLGRHGIVVVPTSATITTIDEITVNSKPWTDTTVTIAWTIYGPGGLGDHIAAITQGIGRDNSDKGYSKACTQAFKNLLLRLLCIGDPADDTDGHTHERTDTPHRPTGHELTVRDTYARISALAGTPAADALKQLAGDHGRRLTESDLAANPDWLDTVTAWLDTTTTSTTTTTSAAE